MQMRERKYIRFDFAQALHTPATSAERHDYRIIARTRAVDHSFASALAHAVHFVAAAQAHARKAFARRSTQVQRDLVLPIFSALLQRPRLFAQEPFSALMERLYARKDNARSSNIGCDERIKSKRCTCSSQSNFSSSSLSNFCR
jgi:hypothetical protein